jgi:hypothetical protein
MIFVVIAAIMGIWRYRFIDYWKWVIAAAVWMVISGILFPAYGNLEDPSGDGFLTRIVRAQTADGPGMGIYAIIMLIVMYGLMIYFLSRAWKVHKAFQAAQSEDLYEQQEDQVDSLRKGLEIAAVIVLAALWLLFGNRLLHVTPPATGSSLIYSEPAPSKVPAADVPDAVALSLKAAAVSVNESVPVAVDKVTKLVGATAEGRVFTYRYSVSVPYQSKAYFLAASKAATVPKACGNASMRKDMDTMGVTYAYSYKFAGKPAPLTVKVDKAACASKG